MTTQRKSYLMSVRAFAASLRNHVKYRRAISQMKGLDDFMLRDIGIWRSEIEWYVRKGRPDDLNPPS